MKHEYIKSPINYSGNKYKLLPQILPLFPKEIDTFVDLFCGSGTVGLNVKANHHIYNDVNFRINEILHYLWKYSEYPNSIILNIEDIIDRYGLTKENKDSFNALRNDYNMMGWIDKGTKPLVLYTLMCYSFNHQCRFNNDGYYNSSFGKDRSQFTDNMKKNIIKCCEAFKTQNCTFTSVNFNELGLKVGANVFIYIDPPYYGTTGSYNDGNRLFGDWTLEKELELHRYIMYLDEKGFKFAISNNLTVNEKMKDFAETRGYNIHHLDMNYGNSNYQKKEKVKDDEVLVTNY